jgi:hypothetical protein
MSFTVQEARAAFFSIFALPRITWRPRNKSNVLHKNSGEAHAKVGDRLRPERSGEMS